MKKGLFYEMGVIFSKERRDARAKALELEVNRGRFWELNELNKTGGKLFEGDVALRPAASSQTFPSLDFFRLTGERTNTLDALRGKVTLVTMCVR